MQQRVYFYVDVESDEIFQAEQSFLAQLKTVDSILSDTILIQDGQKKIRQTLASVRVVKSVRI